MASRIFRRWPTAETPILLQIVGRQLGQDIEVDSVVAKRLLVGLQAEVAQPLPDVQIASACASLAICFGTPSRGVSQLRFRCTLWFNDNRLSRSYLAFSAANRGWLLPSASPHPLGLVLSSSFAYSIVKATRRRIDFANELHRAYHACFDAEAPDKTA
jgi:hypothetical protein